MTSARAILWFRQDLRLSDNPALAHLVDSNTEIIPVYILDKHDDFAIGEASRWWLYHSLIALNASLNNKLNFFAGDPEKILNDLISKYQIGKVSWNRCYEPAAIARDTKIKANFKMQGIEVTTFNSALLLEPHETLKEDGSSYRVFTPFFKKNYLSGVKQIRVPLNTPEQISVLKIDAPSLDELNLLPKIKWYIKFKGLWQPGEDGARQNFKNFLKNGLAGYKELRNRPDLFHTSRLSPHLHFGEISPNSIWYKLRHIIDSTAGNGDAEHFLSELVWREFSYNLLYFFPDLPSKNLQSKFDKFPWQQNNELLRKWQTGQTGYPIVDAGMRELWQTGFMHNRVRMIVASFLVKHLMIDWREGEKWFFDCLVDADLANNSASWQWVAGSGADAAPYFRIFNPILQGEKFDPDGQYTKKFVPELKNLPVKYLFAPWLAPSYLLLESNIKLGVTYPKPIVNHEEVRDQALDIYKNLT